MLFSQNWVILHLTKRLDRCTCAAMILPCLTLTLDCNALNDHHVMLLCITGVCIILMSMTAVLMRINSDDGIGAWHGNSIDEDDEKGPRLCSSCL